MPAVRWGAGAKKAETAEITTVSAGHTASVLAPVVLPPGRYWLAHLPSDDNLHYLGRPARACRETASSSVTRTGPPAATFATTTSSCSEPLVVLRDAGGRDPDQHWAAHGARRDDADNGNLLLGQKTTLAQPQVIQSISFYYAPQADGVMRLDLRRQRPGRRPGAKKAWTQPK
jgi:hypothetical protein